MSRRGERRYGSPYPSQGDVWEGANSDKMFHGRNCISPLPPPRWKAGNSEQVFHGRKFISLLPPRRGKAGNSEQVFQGWNFLYLLPPRRGKAGMGVANSLFSTRRSY
jgi:hypothetical protein